MNHNQMVTGLIMHLYNKKLFKEAVSMIENKMDQNFMSKHHLLMFKIQLTLKMDKQVTENHLMKQVGRS